MIRRAVVSIKLFNRSGFLRYIESSLFFRTSLIILTVSLYFSSYKYSAIETTSPVAPTRTLLQLSPCGARSRRRTSNGSPTKTGRISVLKTVSVIVFILWRIVVFGHGITKMASTTPAIDFSAASLAFLFFLFLHQVVLAIFRVASLATAFIWAICSASVRFSRDITSIAPTMAVFT